MRAVLSIKLFLTLSMSLAFSSEQETIKTVIDRPIYSLNPRILPDITTKRMHEFLYRSLTLLNESLEVVPDLASRWNSQDGNRVWNFELPKSNSIPAEEIHRCFENYRGSNPPARASLALPGWKETRLKNSTLTVVLSQPDPFLPENISTIRFFKTASGLICLDPPKGETFIPSRNVKPISTNPEKITLEAGSLRFEFPVIRDDTTRTLKLMKHELDVTQNALSLSKTRWVKENLKKDYSVFERRGTSLSYLAFNLKDPLLANIAVRKAIALAIPREDIVKNKWFGFCEVDTPFPYSVEESNKILDDAGFKKDKLGTRFKLTYITTPVREGFESALLLRDALKKIGIDVVIQTMESAVHTARMRKLQYQLASSRWIGISNASIYYETLHSQGLKNRFAYSNASTDKLLEKFYLETSETERAKLTQEVKNIIITELPYYPLWIWNNALILSKKWDGLDSSKISMNGSFLPLLSLKRVGLGNSP